MNFNDAPQVIRSHRQHPSLAAARAIGEHYVLNGAPPRVVRLGLEALRSMPCADAVETLAAVRVGPTREFIALTALSVAKAWLREAISRGYTLLAPNDVDPLVLAAAVAALTVSREAPLGQIAVDLVAYLRAAAGRFDPLPAI